MEEKYGFDIRALKLFSFNPTKIFLTPLYATTVEVEGQQVPATRIKAEQVQALSDGDNITKTTFKNIPDAVLSTVVAGYQFGTRTAIINTAALNVILAGFDIEIVTPEPEPEQEPEPPGAFGGA